MAGFALLSLVACADVTIAEDPGGGAGEPCDAQNKCASGLSCLESAAGNFVCVVVVDGADAAGGDADTLMSGEDDAMALGEDVADSEATDVGSGDFGDPPDDVTGTDVSEMDDTSGEHADTVTDVGPDVEDATVVEVEDTGVDDVHDAGVEDTGVDDVEDTGVEDAPMGEGDTEVTICEPDCTNKTCGPDGCGGTCGPECPSDGGGCLVGTCLEKGGSASCALVAAPSGTACADDGLPCTTDACNAVGECTHDVNAAHCLIGGACYEEDAQDPENPCLACVPGLSLSGWSPLPAGTACPSDGISCTADVCDAGNCTHELAVDTCLIQDTCYEAGEQSPASDCDSCDPGLSTTAWTDNGTCAFGCAQLLVPFAETVCIDSCGGEDCMDGLDNNAQGGQDCDDFQCSADPGCVSANESRFTFDTGGGGWLPQDSQNKGGFQYAASIGAFNNASGWATNPGGPAGGSGWSSLPFYSASLTRTIELPTGTSGDLLLTFRYAFGASDPNTTFGVCIGIGGQSCNASAPPSTIAFKTNQPTNGTSAVGTASIPGLAGKPVTITFFYDTQDEPDGGSGVFLDEVWLCNDASG